MITTLHHVLQDISGLFYPNLCTSCQVDLLEGEVIICTSCSSKLQQATSMQNIEHILSQRFLGKAHITNVFAAYYFARDTPLQAMMHALKYEGKQDVGLFLGNYLGRQLKQQSWMQDIDCIIPIPLSEKKKQLRGYNQSEIVAQALSEALQIRLDLTSLVRVKNTLSQTTMTLPQRYDNLLDAFKCEPFSSNTKHILLIDDVITTGSTIESAVRSIRVNAQLEISVAALAFAIN